MIRCFVCRSGRYSLEAIKRAYRTIFTSSACVSSQSFTAENPSSRNENFGPEYINRNPMNLERNFIAYKPDGFELDSGIRKYWNKAVLEKSNRHTTGKIVHYTGRVIVTASTQEWAIRKQLYSATDISAVRNIARVLAQRCLQSGILFVTCDFLAEEMETERAKIFTEALREGGLSLTEPETIEPPSTRHI